MATCFDNTCMKQISGGLREVPQPPSLTNPDQSTREPKKVYFCEDHEKECRLNPRYADWVDLTEHELRNS